MSQLELIASCAFGLESVVKYELELLGYTGRIGQPGQIQFSGDASAICRTNLWLRSADRVRICLARFPASDFDALFDTTKSMDWTKWIPRDGAFPVKGRSLKSQLTSVPAVQRSVKKAIVSSLQQRYGEHELAENGPEFPLEIAILSNEATLTLDTTGPSLHKRGYRSRNGPAPLKETLAAALVQLSFWQAGRPLLDPFCGTGTIPIEAAMIGRQIAPGLKRSFAAESWPWLPSHLWEQARAAALDAIQPPLTERLAATDQDEFSLKLARDNALQAGVADDVHIQQKSFAQLMSKRKYGCLITNPPYGQRIGETSELQDLYELMPAIFSRLPTWSHFVLTAFPSFEKIVQKSADRRRKLYNGRIQCTYYQFHGPKPAASPPSDSQDQVAEPSPSGVRSVPETESTEPTAAAGVQTALPKPAFGGLTPKASEQAELFHARLTKRLRHLRRWPTRQGITCFRLYDRDIPEVPLVVDRYEDFLHIVEFERPHERDLAQHAEWLELMAKTAAQAVELSRSHVFLKQRRRQRGRDQHEKHGDQGFEIIAREGGLQFHINLSDYADTGLFLDHRLTRQRIREEATQKRFLNLFSYTGAFTAYAADGGAASTTSVDLSPVYQSWAQRNMQLNGFSGSEHQFVQSDALTFLRRLPPTPQFDLVVVDPPTFSNSKRTTDVWDVQRGHVECLQTLCDRVEPGGVIYFSTNFRRFKLLEDQIPVTSIREISRQTIPDDYRNQRIHRCWRLVK